MTDIPLEDRDLIDRYLANRLTETEVLVVETRIVEDVVFRNEVELTEALRDGLRELQSRGEIAPLLSHRRSMWRHPRFALAASLAAVALGVASFLFFQRLDDGSGELVVASLRFEHTRGAETEPDVVWRQTGAPTRLQMLFDVGLEPATAWHVRFEKVADGAVLRIMETTAMLNADGLAEISVESAALEPGDYRITLIAVPPTAPAAPIVFALRVSGQV